MLQMVVKRVHTIILTSLFLILVNIYITIDWERNEDTLDIICVRYYKLAQRTRTRTRHPLALLGLDAELGSSFVRCLFLLQPSFVDTLCVFAMDESSSRPSE
jgi:hypothetical protein